VLTRLFEKQAGWCLEEGISLYRRDTFELGRQSVFGSRVVWRSVGRVTRIQLEEFAQVRGICIGVPDLLKVVLRFTGSPVNLLDTSDLAPIMTYVRFSVDTAKIVPSSSALPICEMSFRNCIYRLVKFASPEMIGTRAIFPWPASLVGTSVRNAPSTPGNHDSIKL
jgi:hypothetical protein